MRKFEFISKNYFNRNISCILKFYKIYNKDLYYIVIEEIEYTQESGKPLVGRNVRLGEGLAYSRLNKFLNFNKRSEELKRYLGTNFQHETIRSKTCFSSQECDRIMEWLESFKIIDKSVEE